MLEILNNNEYITCLYYTRPCDMKRGIKRWVKNLKKGSYKICKEEINRER